MGVYAPLMEAAPPIGIARLAAVCGNIGHETQVIDAYSERLSTHETVERLNNPDIIGVSCLTPSASFVDLFIKEARAKYPDAKVVLGNVHANVFAEYYIVNNYANVVVHGEGESTVKELCTIWEEGKTPDENVPGITFNKDGRAVTTRIREPIKDLDALPIPDWHLTPYHLYGLLPFVTMAKPALTIEGSRGCPYNCYFCSLIGSGKRYRMFSTERIAEEFCELSKRYKAKQIAFADAMFPLNEEQGIDFCDSIMSKLPESARVIWTTETRTDAVTPALLKKMKEAGCGRILLGIESGSNETLQNVNKKLKIEKTREAVEACRKAGIQTCGFLMIGLPGETKSSAEETVRFACSLPLDVAKFNIAIPYPGSKFYDDLNASGELRHKRWEDYTCYVTDPDQLPWVNPEWKANELIKYQNKALRRFYLRFDIIMRHLFVIKTIRPWHLAVGGYVLLSSIFKDLGRR